MNLLLLAAFNLILALMMMELDSDKIMKDNILKAMEGENEMLVLLNAENELWRIAEISGENNLDFNESLRVWREAFPEISVELTGKCAKKEPTPEDISERVIIVPEKNMTTTSSPLGCGTETLILRYGDQNRTIYIGGSSGFGEERNWTYTD